MRYAPIFITTAQLLALPEYSMSLPTGTVAGKRWRRADRPQFNQPNDPWNMGEYGEPYPEGHQHHGSIPIIWRHIIVTDAVPCWPRHIAVPSRRCAPRQASQ